MLDELRKRYPWPAEKPDVPRGFYDHLPHGWCCQQNVEMFKRLTPPGALVVELGSWMGRSAMAFMRETDCTLCCVDHWLGSPEHHRNPDWASRLPVLFETFRRNLWDYRERIIPVRTNTIDGMGDIARVGAKVDLVYIDAAHDADSVAKDLATALRLFPEAQICGDDWNFKETVMVGIGRVVDIETVYSDKVCWWL